MAIYSRDRHDGIQCATAALHYAIPKHQFRRGILDRVVGGAGVKLKTSEIDIQVVSICFNHRYLDICGFN